MYLISKHCLFSAILSSVGNTYVYKKLWQESVFIKSLEMLKACSLSVGTCVFDKVFKDCFCSVVRILFLFIPLVPLHFRHCTWTSKVYPTVVNHGTEDITKTGWDGQL